MEPVRQSNQNEAFGAPTVSVDADSSGSRGETHIVDNNVALIVRLAVTARTIELAEVARL
jgi:hypothetical protein